MSGVNWGLYDPNAYARGVAQADQAMRPIMEGLERRSLGRAMNALAANPADPKAMEFLYRTRPDLALKMQDRARDADTRNALASYLLGDTSSSDGRSTPMPAGGVNALMMPAPEAARLNGGAAVPPGGQIAPTGEMRGNRAPGPVRSPAYEMAVRADPEAFLTFEGKRLDVTGKQLKQAMDLNDYGMQLLGGVSDDASLAQAKERAREVYRRFGMPTDFIDSIPDTYSPELVRQLQMQGMSSKEQLAAIARENRLEWDIQDDELDNERADRNTDSMVDYRQGQLSNTRRGQDMTDARGRRGQNLTDARGRRGQDLTDARGRRRQDLADQRARDGVGDRSGRRGQRPRGGGNTSPEGTIIQGPGGQRMVKRGGQWVPLQ
jgi:hypothetical protein